MMAHVFILASCRNPALLAGTLLVFQTLRTGFPTAGVTVIGNALQGDALAAVSAACGQTGAAFTNADATIHDAWVDQLVLRQSAPFVIVDTDMVFWESVEGWQFIHPLAGEHQLPWYDEYSGCVYRERLHTCLLFVDPVEVRRRIAEWAGTIRTAPWRPQIELVRQSIQPRLNKCPVYCDTAANLYQAIGGQHFTPRQQTAYAHLHAGTWVDICQPHLTAAPDLAAAHAAVYRNGQVAREFHQREAGYLAANRKLHADKF